MSEQQTYQDDEITLKELILKVKEYALEVWNSKLTVVLFCALGLAFFLYKHYTTPITYSAESRFIVEGSGGMGGGIAGLLGQFGIRRDSKVNPYKIQEVAKSSKLIQKIIFKKINDTLIANRIIDLYEFHKSWDKNPNEELHGFYFTQTELSKFSDTENIAMKAVLNKIIGGPKTKDPLLSVSFDEDSGIFKIGFTTTDADLSMEMEKLLYEEIRIFFEESIVANQAQTVKILEAKADSLQALITSKTYAAASLQDRSLGLISNVQQVKSEKLQKEVTVLSTALAEVIKSLEVADISLKDVQPMFLQIDESLPPLKGSDSSIIMTILKGGIIGFLIAMVFVFGRKVYRDAMA